MSTTKAPTTIMLSGLNGTASALAVYASSGASRHATQDSLPAVGHGAGRDWLPAGLHGKVSDNASYISSPFLKLAWRKDILDSPKRIKDVPFFRSWTPQEFA